MQSFAMGGALGGPVGLAVTVGVSAALCWIFGWKSEAAEEEARRDANNGN